MRTREPFEIAEGGVSLSGFELQLSFSDLRSLCFQPGMQDDEVLADQPAISSILDKKISRRRNGRKDVEYLVEFVDLPRSQAAWHPAKFVRKRCLSIRKLQRPSSASFEILERRSTAVSALR